MLKNYIDTYQEIDEKYFKVYDYQIANYDPNEELKNNTIYVLNLTQFPIKITDEKNILFMYLIVSKKWMHQFIKRSSR